MMEQGVAAVNDHLRHPIAIGVLHGARVHLAIVETE
jgi:hypothetical protein